MLNSSSINIGSQPDNNHSLTLLGAEPVPERSVPADLQNLLGNRSLQVKEERALIRRRTVGPPQPQAPPSPAFNFAGVIPAPPALGALLPQCLRKGKIARLPKLERDMVNKLLHHHVPSRLVKRCPIALPAPPLPRCAGGPQPQHSRPWHRPTSLNRHPPVTLGNRTVAYGNPR
ncbi:MAG TPA: hypothetical protein VG146_00660 [Verrucomicrobiae bacterium]|nr:hypothetical protein [Verrucomicrobiae bacterium]